MRKKTQMFIYVVRVVVLRVLGYILGVGEVSMVPIQTHVRAESSVVLVGFVGRGLPATDNSFSAVCLFYICELYILFCGAGGGEYLRCAPRC